MFCQQNYLPGPSTIAWISETSSSFGITLIPSGGVFINSANSFDIFLNTFGARFSTFEDLIKIKKFLIKIIDIFEI